MHTTNTHFHTYTLTHTRTRTHLSAGASVIWDWTRGKCLLAFMQINPDRESLPAGHSFVGLGFHRPGVAQRRSTCHAKLNEINADWACESVPGRSHRFGGTTATASEQTKLSVRLGGGTAVPTLTTTSLIRGQWIQITNQLLT